MGVVRSGSVNLGQLWGGGESLEKAAGVVWGRADGKVLECRAGNSFFARVCPQHLLLEEMDDMGNWPPPE